MAATTTFVVRSDALDWRASLRWLADAARLFRRAPFALFVLALLPIAFEAICQAVPVVGIVGSKLLTPFVSAWAFVLLDRKARHDAFAMREATRYWRAQLPGVAGIALFAAGVFGVQLAVAALLGSAEQAAAIAFGQVAALDLSRAQLALVLVSGLIVTAPLTFVVPRVLFDRVGLHAAIRESIHVAARHWRPVLVLTTLLAGLLAAAMWWPWLLLVLLPLGLCAGYAAYRDVFDARIA